MPSLLMTASTYSHIKSFHLPYLRRFADLGFRVTVGCAGEGPLPDGVELLPLPFEKRITSLGNLRARDIIARELEMKKHDLVIAHTSLASFFTRLALPKKKHPPCVNVVHGYLFDDESSLPRRLALTKAEELVAGRTDLTLTMNRWDYDFARKKNLSRRVNKIHGMGVDFTRFDAPWEDLRGRFCSREDQFVFVCPAELSGRKSQEVLIRALARVPERAVLVLAGGGARQRELEDLAASMGLSDRVFFPGFVEDMNSLLRSSDALAAASRIEGLPFGVMEAMYCSLPVIASDVKGHRDLIDDRRTGLLYPYGDVRSCADAMAELMRSPRLRTELGSAARRTVRRYGLDMVFENVMTKYLSAM